MSTVNGLPAHALLVHFIVVLGPLTAVLAILCALWPAARDRLVWLVLGLSVVTTALAPLTTGSGEWLEHRIGKTPAIHVHSHIGDTMPYVLAALFVATLLLVVLHIRKSRGANISRAFSGIVAVLVLAAGITTLVQTYRVGDTGAKATWGGLALEAVKPVGK